MMSPHLILIASESVGPGLNREERDSFHRSKLPSATTMASPQHVVDDHAPAAAPPSQERAKTTKIMSVDELVYGFESFHAIVQPGKKFALLQTELPTADFRTIY